ncbi:MAG: aromatic-ring-hydroxylating dioxygenase subunit beta [Achromobacter sp.]|jgi:anthranilate 1,2-dioxygenase small subunit|uniref:Anthranilate 1,2-dioxygenase small subunit n=1 Tax=Achromobacter insuavis TaxID=1287735 RepID=A0A6J5AL61_9BURK|nr:MULTISPECIES: aromatic-ring-hydroxylating dioxygenase subunit beta [Achromobacter]MBN9638513.1 aromatic-ring-hydroxylating dioxygenase subunit beta [Achromobacter sp.]MCG2598085.1 aromatic-ring-hydroxylating dioxygenase subunit beta [Achromobacter sp.]MCG2604973.1 aromatic-ring-hydroxylating dioxygenase subunit beta [Achromobacter sp.]CAB3669864.1 Anthranilate 1,2-dioxygenase small subunit [Achromobacter insuavis]CUI92731.1 Anthranilate 1%2C2-dioxygenase small subunit [Achromobacter sp. 278
MTQIQLPDDTSLRARLRDFYDDYAYCLDEDRLEEWPDFFTEDCHYRVLSRENHDAGLPLGLIYCMNKNMLRDRVTALRETTMFEPRSLRHFISGVRVIEAQGERIVAQANFAVMESLSDREPTLNMVGRYLDELRLTPQGLALTRRDCVYDNYRVRTSLIVPL